MRQPISELSPTNSPRFPIESEELSTGLDTYFNDETEEPYWTAIAFANLFHFPPLVNDQ